MKIVSATHRGLDREINEDRALVRQFDNGACLLAVADGMGGHPAGELAAQIAVDSLKDFDPNSQGTETQMIELVLAARRKVNEASAEDQALKGLGTTLTVVFIEDATAHWLHVGDSRLYLFREGVLVQMTEDHTIAGLLLKQGEITREAARVHHSRNMLLNCIGCQQFEVDTGCFEVEAGDLLMLSTDGFHDMLSEENMESVMRSIADLRGKLEALVHAAIAAGGRDDATIVAVMIEE